MKKFFVLCAVLSLSMSLVGCEKKAEVKKQTTVSTPDGETTKTDTTTVESSGDNPPATP